MIALSPIAAALEGPRTMRRHPASLLVWGGFYWAALILLWVLLAVAFGEEVRRDLAQTRFTADPKEVLDLIAHLGGAMALLILLAAAICAVLASAILRSVLHPEQSRGAYLRLGADEVRLFVVALITWAAALFVTAIPSGLVTLLTATLAGAGARSVAAWIAFLGGLGVIGLSMWVGVRLSLLSPQTFAEGRINLREAWVLTHGHFWGLLGMFVLNLFMAFVLTPIVFSLVGGLLTGVIALVGGGSKLFVLLGLLTNVLIAPLMFTVQTVILTAGPARAYRQLHPDI
ncbi:MULTISPECIES: hypothetical protein [unclassified Caulobacter]|uniref:hypothetical protein n=1 Tax=unclassified Caulobacter TaxID=2648921 RepID=UPI001E48311E|nr:MULTISPECIES: hypothetical protein [unclassified Caulobacter]